jgi:putative ABC transport system permease protein
VLLEPLPFRDPDRLVVLWETNGRRAGRPNVLGPSNFHRWRESATAFRRMAPFYDYRVNLTGAGEAEELIAQDVRRISFRHSGVSPLASRAFAPDEGRRAQRWRSELRSLAAALAADAGIVGRTIQLGGRPITVIGVMPAKRRLFVKRGSLTDKPPDLAAVCLRRSAPECARPLHERDQRG